MEVLNSSPNISVFLDTVQYSAFLDATVLVVLLFKKKNSHKSLYHPPRGDLVRSEILVGKFKLSLKETNLGLTLALLDP